MREMLFVCFKTYKFIDYYHHNVRLMLILINICIKFACDKRIRKLFSYFARSGTLLDDFYNMRPFFRSHVATAKTTDATNTIIFIINHNIYNALTHAFVNRQYCLYISHYCNYKTMMLTKGTRACDEGAIWEIAICTIKYTITPQTAKIIHVILFII